MSEGRKSSSSEAEPDGEETLSDLSDDQPEVKRQRRCPSSPKLPTGDDSQDNFEPGDYLYFSSSDSEKVIEAVERAERTLRHAAAIVSRSVASSSRYAPPTPPGYTRHLRVSILAVLPTPTGSDTDSSSVYQDEEVGPMGFPERWHQILEDSDWSKSSASEQSAEANADDQVYEMEFEVASISESELNQNPIEDAESSSGSDNEGVKVETPAEDEDLDEQDSSSGVDDNFADEESDISVKSDKDSYNISSDSELEKDKWPCHQCKALTHAVSRYCLRCFRTRRNWLPKRPKSRRARARDKLKDGKSSRSDPTSTSESGNDPGNQEDSPKDGTDGTEEVSLNEGIEGASNTAFQSDSQSSVNASNSFQDLTPSASCASSQTSQSSDGSRSRLGHQRLHLSKKGSTSGNGLKSPTKKNLKARENLLNMEAVSIQNSRAARNHDIVTCDFCFEREKDAAFVHNKIAHQCCCFPCANKILRRTGKCPICRERILRVVRVINA